MSNEMWCWCLDIGTIIDSVLARVLLRDEFEGANHHSLFSKQWWELEFGKCTLRKTRDWNWDDIETVKYLGWTGEYVYVPGKSDLTNLKMLSDGIIQGWTDRHERALLSGDKSALRRAALCAAKEALAIGMEASVAILEDEERKGGAK